MNKGLVFIFLPLLCVMSIAFAAEETPSPTPVVTPVESPVEKTPAAAIVAPTNTFESSYNLGIKLSQSKDYEKSRDAFAKALELDPHNTSALTNLALVQFRLNQKGLAIANLRKVLELDPEQPTAKAALKFALSQMETKEIPHKIETYETVREQFLQPVTLNIYVGLTALFLFAGGWSLLAYIGKRKKALLAEEASPNFPAIATLLNLGFLIFAGLSALKFYDQSLLRGTIVDEKVNVQAAPGENQVSLFDLYAGFEVIVQKSEPDWVQVTYPGASTGWIKKSSLIVTSHP